jgi:CRP-like cAMP-binding protein
MKSADCHNHECFLCRHCLPEWKDLIMLKKSVLVIRKGKTLFRQGEEVKGIFFIHDGSVKISMGLGEQKHLIIRFAKKGDVLGYRGFGGDLHYPISATALEDSKMCFIENDFLAASLKANSSLTYHLMQVYAKELHTAERRMRDLVQRDVKERIVLALFEMSDAFGTTAEQFISLPISRQDIASYAGTSYETVFKFFTELSGRRILSTAGKNVKINDRNKLREYLSEHS